MRACSARRPAETRFSASRKNGVQLYYYDGAIYLENGSAYRTNGLFPDYSTLGEHLLELYNATDAYARESGEEVYSVTAYGKDAEQALSLLTPTIADSLSAVESIDLCMHIEDGVIRSIEASGSCQAENSAGQMQPMTVWAELTVQPDAQRARRPCGCDRRDCKRRLSGQAGTDGGSGARAVRCL